MATGQIAYNLSGIAICESRIFYHLADLACQERIAYLA
jgi:hypothetical protein